jgi:hypothetical protein
MSQETVETVTTVFPAGLTHEQIRGLEDGGGLPSLLQMLIVDGSR